MATMHWVEDERPRSAHWHSESDAPAPSRVVVIGDDTTANAAYRLARQDTGLLWRGDYHNARQLLSAMARRVERQTARRRVDPTDFVAYRAARAERARVLGRLIVQLEEDYTLRLRRSPDVRQACRDAYGEPTGTLCVALSELHGVLSARQWHEKGVPIPALEARIHPCYGVFSPVRGEYIDLAAAAPLPGPAVQTAFDLGTGTGVLAAVLARRGVQQVIATDINPRAVVCARENIARLGYSGQVQTVEADLYPPGQADLILCNPPWLPARPTSALELGIYDSDSDMLHRFLDGLAARLRPGGQGWLILSDLAEHLGLRTRTELLQRITRAGLQIVDRLETTPTHSRASDSADALHAARSRETTTLWRLEAVTGPAPPALARSADGSGQKNFLTGFG